MNLAAKRPIRLKLEMVAPASRKRVSCYRTLVTDVFGAPVPTTKFYNFLNPYDIFAFGKKIGLGKNTRKYITPVTGTL